MLSDPMPDRVKELLRIPVGKSVSTENAINAQTPDRQKGLEISNRNFPL